MTIVRHQRARAALRMVVLGGGKSVVDDAASRRRSQRCARLRTSACGRRIDLARRSRHARRKARRVPRRATRPSPSGRSANASRSPLDSDAALEPRAAAAARRGAAGTASSTSLATSAPRHRSGSTSIQSMRDQQLGNVVAQMLALALAQIGLDFEQPVACRQRVARRQRGEHVGGEPAGARSELDDIDPERRSSTSRELRRERTRRTAASAPAR